MGKGQSRGAVRPERKCWILETPGGKNLHQPTWLGGRLDWKCVQESLREKTEQE